MHSPDTRGRRSPVALILGYVASGQSTARQLDNILLSLNGDFSEIVRGHGTLRALSLPAPPRHAPASRRESPNSAIVMSTGILARSKSLFVNYFASQLGGGVISAIALATKRSAPVQRGAFYAARMIMFSRTARLHAEGDVREMVQLYEFGVRASFLLLAPFLWWAGLHADTLVDLIFGHGAFTQTMVDQVGSVLVALIPAVLFLGVGQLLSNAFYAMDRVTVPAIVMPLVTLAYAALAGPISSRLGPPGLTLTTSIVSFAMFLSLVVMLTRELPGFRAWRVLSAISVYILLAGASLAGVTMFAEDLGDIPAAAITLPAGAVLYAGSLVLARDLTLRRIVEMSRGMIVRRATI